MELIPNTNSKSTGNIGESIACRRLQELGFRIIERNYWRPCGEIDIIATKDRCVHFIEVKTKAFKNKEKITDAVSYETNNPANRVDKEKLKKIKYTIDTWKYEQKYRGEWQIDIVAAYIVPYETFAVTHEVWDV